MNFVNFQHIQYFRNKWFTKDTTIVSSENILLNLKQVRDSPYWRREQMVPEMLHT